MPNIAIIGSSEFTLGFKLAGIKKTVAIEENDNASLKMNELLKDEAVGIIVTEQKIMDELTENLKESALSSVKPSVVVLSKNSKDEGLRSMIKKSIGIDLWK